MFYSPTWFCPFDARKTIQAIGVVLRNHGSSVATKLRVLKVLYIADREAIKETGRPILGCRTVAMDHGPLHSAVLNLINGEHVEEPLFSAHFSKTGYQLALKVDPGVERLSRFEIEKLREVCERYGDVNDWSLAHDVTHGFDEWVECYREKTSTPIPLERIIRAVGREEDSDEIMKELMAEAEADRLFGEQSK